MTKKFPLRATKEFMSRICQDDKNDPLLRQILPTSEENKHVAGFAESPLSEEQFTPIPGLLHKYFGRVLLLVADKCPINCRFCFRRFTSSKIINWAKVFQYIKNDNTITEVILSGGEPLMCSDKKLATIIGKLAKIGHIKRLRIHTRMPIVLPERITASLIRTLKSSRLSVVMVVHCNHPNEVDTQVAAAFLRLRKANIVLLSQSVLLKGVNDSTETLIALSEKLFSCGVVPYYLHLLDKVKGTAHFQVTTKRAIQIHRLMQERLSGYLAPILAYEKPSAKAKVRV